MLRLIKQVFIGLLSFSASLWTKYTSFNNESWMTRPTLKYVNPVKFNYYPFIISLDKYNGSCNNVVNGFSAKVCVPSKTKGVNVKVFNMITRINEAKNIHKTFFMPL